MTLKLLAKPATALAGKTFALHVESNLMVMTNATLGDVRACKGILVETSTGFIWYLGWAYLDMMARLKKELGAEPTTLDQVSSFLARRRKFNYTFKQIKGSKDAILSVVRPPWSTTTTTGGEVNGVQLVATAAYAVPHACVAGHGASQWQGGPRTFGLSQVTPSDSSGNTDFNGAWGSSYLGPAAALGYGYDATLPQGWVLGAAGGSRSVGEQMESMIMKLDDMDNIRSKVRTGLRAFLASKGIPLNQRIYLPLFVTTDGRQASDLAFRQAGYGPYGGRTGATGEGQKGDPTLPLMAGRLRFGDGDYETFPLGRNNALYGSGNVLRPFVKANDPYLALDLDGVTETLKKKIGDLEVRGLTGHQPFGAFYSVDNAGVYAHKLVDEIAMTDPYWLQWASFCYAKDTTQEPQPGGASAAQSEERGRAMLANISTTGGQEANETATAADSWMLTLRTLMRLVWDPIQVEGNNSIWKTSIAENVFATPNADGSQNTGSLTV